MAVTAVTPAGMGAAGLEAVVFSQEWRPTPKNTTPGHSTPKLFSRLTILYFGWVHLLLTFTSLTSF
jgi:hypothetical protein